jgi:hypothetical protein
VKNQGEYVVAGFRWLPIFKAQEGKEEPTWNLGKTCQKEKEIWKAVFITEVIKVEKSQEIRNIQKWNS